MASITLDRADRPFIACNIDCLTVPCRNSEAPRVDVVFASPTGRVFIRFTEGELEYALSKVGRAQGS